MRPLTDERRNAVTAAVTVGVVVLVLGFVTGIGALIPQRRLVASASPAGPGRPTGVTPAAVSGPLTAGPAPAQPAATVPAAAVPGAAVPAAAVPAAAAPSTASSSTGSARTPATSPSAAGGAPAVSTSAATCTHQMLVSAVLHPLVTHLEKAHLEESPAQQLADLLHLNQYLLTHTVLIANMLAPVFTLLAAAPTGLAALVSHLDHAHLEESPAQQLADVLNVNQYVLTHTVLVENILNPIVQALDGTYGC